MSTTAGGVTRGVLANHLWSSAGRRQRMKLLRFGTQLVSLGGGVRYWLDSPDSGAEGLGVRVIVTLLFPR